MNLGFERRVSGTLQIRSKPSEDEERFPPENLGPSSVARPDAGIGRHAAHEKDQGCGQHEKFEDNQSHRQSAAGGENGNLEHQHKHGDRDEQGIDNPELLDDALPGNRQAIVLLERSENSPQQSKRDDRCWWGNETPPTRRPATTANHYISFS